MQAKISKRSVDALAAPPGGEVVVWDTHVKGFGVRVRGGGVKTYVVRYRLGSGRGGTHSQFHDRPTRQPVDTRHRPRRSRPHPRACRKRRRSRRQAADGSRGPDRRRPVRPVFGRGMRPTKKPTTLATDRGRIKRHIIPLLGRKKVKDLTRADIQRFMQDVAAGKTACDEKTASRGRAIVEGGKGTATRTVGLLGGILTFAVERGICPTNPVHGVKRYRDRKGERFLSARELAALGLGLAVMEETATISPIMANAVRLLLLTGCRKTEVLSLCWSFVDFERGYLRLPDSKTGEKTVPLGAPALKVLSDLPRLSDWVFPAATGGGHLVGLPHAWDAVRVWCGLDGVRLHDLRHSFASVGAISGNSLPVIGALLGHADSKTTSRYAHLTADPIKAAAERIANTIADAMSGAPDRMADVVPLSSHGRRA